MHVGFQCAVIPGAGPQKPEQRVDSGNKISALTAPLGLDENGLLELD